MSFFEQIKSKYLISSTVERLIYWNVAIAIVFTIFEAFGNPIYRFLLLNLSLSSDFDIFITKPWTLFTYSFVHANFIHLLFNMLMLFFIGQLFQTFFTQVQLFTVYILGGIFGGIIYLATVGFFVENTLVVGASGAIMALLFATTFYRPNMNIRLMLIGNVKIWVLAAVFIALDLVQIPSDNSGGHITHLGGALFGFIYIALLKKGFDLSICFTWVKNLFSQKKKTKHSFKNVYKNTSEQKTSFKQAVRKDEVQSQIDVILDKISKSGYESLSKSEREFLFKQR